VWQLIKLKIFSPLSKFWGMLWNVFRPRIQKVCSKVWKLAISFIILIWPIIKKFGFRVVFILTLSTILIFPDIKHIPKELPMSKSETVTENIPFGNGAIVNSNGAPSSNVNVPPATILQYAYQKVKVTTLTEDFKKIFLTGTNLFWIVIFGKVLISILAYFIITLPFRKLESLEFGGLKYKEQAEKQEEIAVTTMKTIQADEQKRLSFLNALINDDGVYQAVASSVNSYNSFNQYSVSEYLASLLSTTFNHLEGIGVVPVTKGNLNVSQMATIGQKASALIRQANVHKQQKLDEDQGLTFAVPLLYEDTDVDFTILYGSSSKGLTESDMFMILAAWGIITYQLDLEMTQRSTQGQTGS
jgi:hypothetical protein